MLVACECVCLQEAEDAGEDYERQKMLQTSASELERKQRKRKKKNPDTGFAGELHSLSLSLLPLSPPSFHSALPPTHCHTLLPSQTMHRLSSGSMID